MVDIAKCNGQIGDKICTKRDDCYRYLAKSDERQSYFMPIDVDKCGHYWECKSVSEQRRLDIQNGC